MRWLWHIVRLPMLTLLVIVRPVVVLMCGGLALLGVLMTVFFRVVEAPHFPAGTMLTISLSFGLALVLYEALIRGLSN
jgi:hypothetical protein